jgi:WD40 repeat protein
MIGNLVARGTAIFPAIVKMCSYDSSSQDYVPMSTIRTHKGEITGVAEHPMSTIAILSSLDYTYSVHDLSNFTLFQSIPSHEPFTPISIHPDGTFLALETPTSKLHTYDAQTCNVAATLILPNSTPFIVIWDLHKQESVAPCDCGTGLFISTSGPTGCRGAKGSGGQS